MFSWFQTFVTPFVIAFGGEFWHDTVALVIPPTDTPIDISYIPDPNYKSMVIGLTFGDAYEYDPTTDTIGPEIYSTDVGIKHSTRDYMAWHWDPFVKSILKTNPYPQLLWASKERPYRLRVLNYRTGFVWSEATFWVIKFPRKVACPIWGECDPEDLFRRYMEGVCKFFIAISKIPIENLLRLLETPPTIVVGGGKK